MKEYILGRVQKANLQTKHEYEELCIYKYKEFKVNRFERKLNKFKSVIVVNNFSRRKKEVTIASGEAQYALRRV